MTKYKQSTGGSVGFSGELKKAHIKSVRLFWWGIAVLIILGLGLLALSYLTIPESTSEPDSIWLNATEQSFGIQFIAFGFALIVMRYLVEMIVEKRIELD